MDKQTILWTALPNGFSKDGKSMKVSLLVSPRLQPDTDFHLKSFPDFVDWPATLARSTFVLNYGASNPVKIAGDNTRGRTRIDDQYGTADSNVWRALFPETTIVHGFEFRDLSKHSVLSYPVADIEKLIRNLYSKLALTVQDQLPTISEFLNDQDWATLLSAIAENDEQFTDHKNGNIRNVAMQFKTFKDKAIKGDANKENAINNRTLASDLARFQLFHTPPSQPRTDRYNVPPNDAKSRAQWLAFTQTKLPRPDDFQNEIDFHKIVAAMNQYPTLLRRLGLVVDLLVERDAFIPAADGLLWVEMELPQNVPTVDRLPDASPRTHTLLDADQFQAAPRTSLQTGDFQIVNGLIDLDPKTFSLVQTDVDGSGIKVTNFARSLLTLQRNSDNNKFDPVTKHERELGAPALRNSGLVLVHNQRADMLKNSIARQGKFNAVADKIQQRKPNPPTPPSLYSEDLVRGYRIDIWDDISKRWHSLCRREATYDIKEGEIVIEIPEEEGTVRLAATTSPDKSSNPDIIWLHETLVAWLGWSLCAPAPGKTIHHQVTKDIKGKPIVVHEDPVGEPEAEVPPGLNLRTTFKTTVGSLPRLRYGRNYWIRARVVDLASNSLKLLEKDFGPEQSKKNAQPYLRYEPISPPAIALVKPTAATTDTPAEGESMERIAVRSFNDTPPLNVVLTTQRAHRFAVPNRTTQREAEQHGALDKLGDVDPSTFALLASRDNSLKQEEWVGAGPLTDPLVDPVKTKYAVLTDGDALPYLPDPLSLEIAARIFNHPDFPDNKIISIPLYNGAKWPDAQPFKIEVYDNPGDTPHYDSGLHTLLIPLPKAARCILRLSVKPSSDALKLLGIWNWLTPAQQSQMVTINGDSISLEKLARNGQHWMLTPWRNLELVHAVQRPLITPEIVKLEIKREEAATSALPHFIATCSIASTDRLDLQANWNEPFEDADKNILKNLYRIDHAFSVKITDANAYAGSPDYLEEGPNIKAGGLFDDRIEKRIHEFHDTRYRRIEYWLEATTKFREFMPASILTEEVGGVSTVTEKNIKVVGPKTLGWIKCSSPPPAPDILYVVPTFGWVRTSDASSKSSWRRGGGLRVYLNRPWNASGYGEMLAVVLPGSKFTGDPNVDPAEQPLKNFVTQWGNDPIWLSPFVSGAAPTRANFPLSRTSADPDGKWLPEFAPSEEADQPPGQFETTGLEHPDLRNPSPQSRVEVAPHDVFFDEERQLWYCDIEVNWGKAYFPFIRLALARYQPVALYSAHLSNIVLADFMPLVPDRWLNVTQTRDPGTRNVKVFGNTFTDSSSHNEAAHARAASLRLPDGTILNLQAPKVAQSSVVEVWVERFNPALGEDFGWERELSAIVQHNSSTPEPRTLLKSKVIVAKKRLRAVDLLQNREYEALIEEKLVNHLFITPILWDGSVTLPQSPDATARYRLAIAEYEEYLVDGDMPYNQIPTKKDRRLVFIEYVEIV